MARKPPGALRSRSGATRLRPHFSLSPSRRPSRQPGAAPQIPGLSRTTTRAIREVELRRLEPGATATALRGYAAVLRQPGRYIQLEADLCYCCDPLESRDILEVVLRQLPRPARRDLARIVDRLDQEFLRRTLPDPFAVCVSAWHAEAWWRQRLQER